MVLGIQKQTIFNFNLRSLHQSVPVTFTYQVHFTNGLFHLDNSLLAQTIAADGEKTPKQVLIVVDAGLLQYWDGLLEQLTAYTQQYRNIFTLSIQPVVVPGGEAVKNNPKWIEQIHKLIDRAGLCRHSYVLAIGGGAVLDMAGYAAATAHRGIRLIRVPTTVLAQNDSGVGVKNGINAFGKKNFLGTFAPPYAVFNDFDFLTTLEEWDWRSGTAEAVKVALIKDPDFFKFIAANTRAIANRNMDAMKHLIYRCAQLHMEHIANNGDPFEMGSSRPLDFGHWVAHKLEQLTDYNLRHGEAVAIGIALDTTYSYLAGLLPHLEWQQVLETLKELGFKLYISQLGEQLQQPEHPRYIFRGIAEFREHLGGELNITLLQGIGQGIQVNEVEIPLYSQAILLLEKFNK